ncbi:MAG: hypothetical protein U1F57_03515 [bacterium]
MNRRFYKSKHLLISFLAAALSLFANTVLGESFRPVPRISSSAQTTTGLNIAVSVGGVQCEVVQKYERACSWNRPRTCSDLLDDYETNEDHRDTWNNYQELCNPIEGSTNPLDHLRQGENRNTHECLRMLGIADTCRSNYSELFPTQQTATVQPLRPEATIYPATRTATVRACFLSSVVDAVDRFRGICGYDVSPANYRSSASARCRALNESDPIISDYPRVCHDKAPCDCVNTQGCGADFCRHRAELVPGETSLTPVDDGGPTHPLPYGDDVHAVELPADPASETASGHEGGTARSEAPRLEGALGGVADGSSVPASDSADAVGGLIPTAIAKGKAGPSEATEGAGLLLANASVSSGGCSMNRYGQGGSPISAVIFLLVLGGFFYIGRCRV